MAWSNSEFSIPAGHAGVSGHAIAAWNFIESIGTGDYIQIAYGGETTEVYLKSIAAAASPTRPATPAIILTVVREDQTILT